ncbi:Lipoprotein signal peptidase [Dirofilaria immitis]
MQHICIQVVGHYATTLSSIDGDDFSKIRFMRWSNFVTFEFLKLICATVEKVHYIDGFCFSSEHYKKAA